MAASGRYAGRWIRKGQQTGGGGQRGGQERDSRVVAASSEVDRKETAEGRRRAARWGWVVGKKV